jgi:hypothetical protein
MALYTDTDSFEEMDRRAVAAVINRWSPLLPDLTKVSMNRPSQSTMDMLLSVMQRGRESIINPWNDAKMQVMCTEGVKISSYPELSSAINVASSALDAATYKSATYLAKIQSQLEAVFPNLAGSGVIIPTLSAGIDDYGDEVRQSLKRFNAKFNPKSEPAKLRRFYSNVSTPIFFTMAGFNSTGTQFVASATSGTLTAKVDMIAWLSVVAGAGTWTSNTSGAPAIAGTLRVYIKAGQTITLTGGVANTDAINVASATVISPGPILTGYQVGDSLEDHIGTGPCDGIQDTDGVVGQAIRYYRYLRSRGLPDVSIARYFLLRFRSIRIPSDNQLALDTNANIGTALALIYDVASNAIAGGLTRNDDEILLYPEFWLGDDDLIANNASNLYSLRTKKLMYGEYLVLVNTLVETASTDSSFARWSE